MRVLIVLLALVATPFVAGVSQGRGHNDEKCAKRAAQHPGKEINKCDGPTTTPPPPAAACVSSVVLPAGTSSITGTVFDASWSGLSGWCVELSVNGSVVAATLTDASGKYAFTSLPPNTYTVCEVVVSGWQQTYPPMSASCASGLGYEFPLATGERGFFVDFGNTLL
jgi:hypothetical protein